MTSHSSTGSEHPVPTRQRGRLIVLAGPTAVGKSTVVAAVRECVPDLYFSVSMTTRAPRPGEVHGQDYYFVSIEEFRAAVAAGTMLEWAEVHSGLQLSGTPAEPIDEALEDGRPVLVEVDLAGVRSMKRLKPECHTVFLAPPDWEALEERLRSRATEDHDIVARRLATAREELAARDEFDSVVVNGELEAAVSELVRLINNP